MLGQRYSKDIDERNAMLFAYLSERYDRALFLGHLKTAGSEKPLEIHACECNEAFLQAAGLGARPDEDIEWPVRLLVIDEGTDIQRTLLNGDCGICALLMPANGLSLPFSLLPLDGQTLLGFLARSDANPLPGEAAGEALSETKARSEADAASAVTAPPAASFREPSLAAALSGLHAFSQFLIGTRDPRRIGLEILRLACALTDADGAGVRLVDPETGVYGERLIRTSDPIAEPAQLNSCLDFLGLAEPFAIAEPADVKPLFMAEAWDPDAADAADAAEAEEMAEAAEAAEAAEMAEPAAEPAAAAESAEAAALCRDSFKRIMIENLARHPLGATHMAVWPDMRPRLMAVQATPLVSSAGQAVGVLETWFIQPHRFGTLEQQELDLITRQAADALARLQGELMLAHERRNMQALVQRMRRADANKNTFINTLSHELRNPLASIMLSLSILDSAAQGGSESIKARDILKRQTAHLSSLVDDLLDVTRIANNKIRLRPAILDLNAVAARVAEDCRGEFIQRGIDLQVSLAPEPVIIFADNTRMVQVIANLLQNASKFTRQNGWTMLSVAIESNEDADGQLLAVIRVRDSGIGIPAENQRDLFEPFSQLEDMAENNRSGLGLGLAIVKGMVELHGGRISVYSAGKDQGTEFTIRLPLLGDAPGELTVAEERTLPAQKSLRILVIDDSRDLADTVCSLLGILGHTVEAAFDGPSGIAKAIEFKPDVIFCDIGLPVMDGYEVAQLIRRNPETEHIFLVALSGFAQQDDIDHAVRAGFDQHIAKPVTIDIIKRILTSERDMQSRQ